MDGPAPTAAFVGDASSSVDLSSKSKGNIFFAFAALPIAIMGKLLPARLALLTTRLTMCAALPLGSVFLLLTVMRWYNRRQARHENVRHGISVARYSVTVQPNDMDDSLDYGTLPPLEHAPFVSDSRAIPSTPPPTMLAEGALSASTPQLELHRMIVQPRNDDYCAPLLARVDGIAALEAGSDDEA